MSGLPAALGTLHCRGFRRVSETPCGIGGLPALWGAPQSVRGTLQCWGLSVVLGGSLQHGGPGGHLPCCPLTWRPSALSAVNLDHFQILRAIGKGSFGKVGRGRGGLGACGLGRPPGSAGGGGCASRRAGQRCQRPRGAVREPATPRLSWPESLGSCSLAHPQPSWGCRWHTPGLFRGRDPEARRGGKCFRSRSVGGWPPAPGVAVTLETRGQACAEPSLQAGRAGPRWRPRHPAPHRPPERILHFLLAASSS